MRPLPLQNQFNAGMKRDVSRNRMPPNSAWNIVDAIPDYDAPLRERKGWAYANSTSAISSVTGTASYVRGGIFVVFSPTAGEDPANLCVDEDGLLYEISEAGLPTLIGSARTLAQNPIFHGGTSVSGTTASTAAVYTGLVIIPDATLANVPRKYNGTTLSDLGGTPPKAKYATVYKDYTVLGHGVVSGVTYPNRVWFGPVGDPDCGYSGTTVAWDTTDAWIDFSLPIIGLASTKNVMLVFSDGQIARIRGNTPPPEEDMVVDDPWQKLSLLDAFSITEHQDQVYFCAQEGVFRTDGVALDDITLKGGMLRYWLDLVADATSSWTFSTGVIRNKLVISVMDGTTFKDAFMVDMNAYAWTRLSNIKATSFWTGQYGSSDETYFGLRSSSHVGRTNTMFDVDNSSYKADADGTAVASTLETPFYEIGRPGIKTVKGIHVGYYLRDFATDNPTVAVSYIKTPENTSYTALGTLAENTAYNRARVAVGGRMYGIALKFVRANAGDFWGYDLSAEVGYQEESKRMS